MIECEEGSKKGEMRGHRAIYSIIEDDVAYWRTDIDWLLNDSNSGETSHKVLTSEIYHSRLRRASCIKATTKSTLYLRLSNGIRSMIPTVTTGNFKFPWPVGLIPSIVRQSSDCGWRRSTRDNIRDLEAVGAIVGSGEALIVRRNWNGQAETSPVLIKNRLCH